jgi:hypothetical protein
MITEPADATDPKNESAELHPVLQSVYNPIESTEKTSASAWNIHIKEYEAESQDFVSRGIIMAALDASAITVYWIRYQKSASPMVPVPFSLREIAKAL